MFAYALRNELLVYVSEVQRGKACECFCPACGESLVAKKGNVKAHHFAHEAGAECAGSVESALHLAAKECLRQSRKFSLPVFLYRRYERINRHDDFSFMRTLAKGGVVEVERVEIEKTLGGIVADALVHAYGKELIVEVCVTHKVDATKLRKIRELNISAIEIFLDRSDAMLSPEDLTSKIQESYQCKKWLYHPSLPKAELRCNEKFKRVLEAARIKRNERLLLEAELTPEQWWDMAGVDKFARKNMDYQVAMRKFHFRHNRFPTIAESNILC